MSNLSKTLMNIVCVLFFVTDMTVHIKKINWSYPNWNSILIYYALINIAFDLIKHVQVLKATGIQSISVWNRNKKT